MMEMLRKAELMVQKKKRQMIARQIAELEHDLKNLEQSIDSMSLTDYNKLREKLRLLPRELRENYKARSIITKIEQEAYLSRSHQVDEEEEDLKKRSRKAELEVYIFNL